jgi:uncharacterized DUF497 family protein
MGFEWDAAKNRANLAKHGIDFQAAIRIFEGPMLELPDNRRDYGEMPVIAIGAIDGREYTIVYAHRGGDRRIISARRAHEKERKAYRQIFAIPPASANQN